MHLVSDSDFLSLSLSIVSVSFCPPATPPLHGGAFEAVILEDIEISGRGPPIFHTIEKFHSPECLAASFRVHRSLLEKHRETVAFHAIPSSEEQRRRIGRPRRGITREFSDEASDPERALFRARFDSSVQSEKSASRWIATHSTGRFGSSRMRGARLGSLRACSRARRNERSDKGAQPSNRFLDIAPIAGLARAYSADRTSPRRSHCCERAALRVSE